MVHIGLAGDDDYFDNDGYFDQTPTKNNISSTTDLSAKLRRETVLALESMGIPIQNYHHEVAPGQHEIPAS